MHILSSKTIFKFASQKYKQAVFCRTFCYFIENLFSVSPYLAYKSLVIIDLQKSKRICELSDIRVVCSTFAQTWVLEVLSFELDFPYNSAILLTDIHIVNKAENTTMTDAFLLRD